MAAATATFGGELLLNEPMARHTTWRVGGPADRYYRPSGIDDLAAFLADRPVAEAIHWVGLGSNLLVRDGGIRGSVIATAGRLGGIERIDATTLRVEAGTACAKLARYCARAGLTGAEFLAGIPGTMGGALAMNAGAFGGETWGLVEAVETLSRAGVSYRRRPDEYRVGYRRVEGPADEWFVAARLRLAQGDTLGGTTRIRKLLDSRAQSQPLQQANAGSVFRNPPGDHAARLIESCGLKGRRIGAACVSTKHANFIVNEGGATAAQIEALIEEVAAEVLAVTGVRLEREVRIVGEPIRGEEHG